MATIQDRGQNAGQHPGQHPGHRTGPADDALPGLAPGLKAALDVALGDSQPLVWAQPGLKQVWRRTLPTFLFAILFCAVLLPLTAAAFVTGLTPAPQGAVDPAFSGWFILPIAAPLVGAGLFMLAAPFLGLRSAKATVYALTETEAVEVEARAKRPAIRRLAFARVAATYTLTRSDGSGDLILRYGAPDNRGRQAMLVFRGLVDPDGWQALVQARMPQSETAAHESE